jgi:DNA-binding NarL/FixJ family response regulator
LPGSRARAPTNHEVAVYVNEVWHARKICKNEANNSPQSEEIVWLLGVPAPELTPLERAVLAASATGLCVPEVAELLGESPETVRRAVASVVMKLGAGSKLEALVIALRHRLIDIPFVEPARAVTAP